MIVTRKLLIPTLIFVAVMFLGFIAINTANSISDIEANEEQNLEEELGIVQERLESRESFAVGLALEVANNPEVQAAFAAGDRERLTELTLPAYEALDAQFDIPQYQFHLPPATSFLRLHSLDRFDDDLSSFRFTVLAANAEERPVSGPEIGRAGLGVRGIAPVSYQNEHIGTVEFGLNIDQTFLENLREQLGADVQLLLLRGPAEEVATFAGATADLQGPTDQLILQASTFEEPIFAEAATYSDVLEGAPVISRIQAGNQQYAIISAPVSDFSGNTIGVIEIFNNRTAVIADQTRNIITAVIASLITIAVGGVGLTLITTRMLRPIGTLTEAAVAIAEGDLTRNVPVKTDDEIGTLATAFNNMTARLRDMVDSLEQRVADRTRALEISGNVSRQISNILDRQELVKTVVEQIKTAYSFYHVQIYFFDDMAENLIMVGGTGEAGQQMLENQHRIPAGKGLVGRAGKIGQPVLVPDTSQAEDWLPNPLLPETAGELAVPIADKEVIMGVIDVQHNVRGALTQLDADMLLAVANQVAIVYKNVRSFEKQRQRTEFEAKINEMRNRIQATQTVDDALKVAIRELGNAVGSTKTVVRLNTYESENDEQA